MASTYRCSTGAHELQIDDDDLDHGRAAEPCPGFVLGEPCTGHLVAAPGLNILHAKRRAKRRSRAPQSLSDALPAQR